MIVEGLRRRHRTLVNREPAGAATAHVGARLRFDSVLCLSCPFFKRALRSQPRRIASQAARPQATEVATALVLSTEIR